MDLAQRDRIHRQPLRRRAIDVTQRRSVDSATDAAICSGATGFTGGLLGLATSHVSTVYTALPDAISEAAAAQQTAGFNPDVVALHPNDWLAISVAKGSTNDHYLSGSYLGVMPLELRGLRVVLSPSVTEGQALVMDSAHIPLIVVDQFTVEFAYDGTDFSSNLITCLAETRLAVLYLTVGAARIVTPDS